MIDHRVLVGGAVLLLAVVAAVATRRLRFPLLITFLGLVLATFALSAGIAGDNTIFNTVFFVVVVSTLIQGLTLEPFARRLDLTTGSN